MKVGREEELVVGIGLLVFPVVTRFPLLASIRTAEKTRSTVPYIMENDANRFATWSATADTAQPSQQGGYGEDLDREDFLFNFINEGHGRRAMFNDWYQTTIFVGYPLTRRCHANSPAEAMPRGVLLPTTPAVYSKPGLFRLSAV
jgi:hypothetical protein